MCTNCNLAGFEAKWHLMKENTMSMLEKKVERFVASSVTTKISTDKDAEAVLFKLNGLENEILEVSKMFFTSDFAVPLLRKLSRPQQYVENRLLELDR